nr:MAG TPA: hypothetical protein [Caudoviricetes sp.]
MGIWELLHKQEVIFACVEFLDLIKFLHRNDL